MLLFVAMFASARWWFFVSYLGTPGASEGTQWSVYLRRGTLEVTRTVGVTPSDHSPVGLDAGASRAWGDEVSLAWRPYHVSSLSTFVVGSTDGMVFPLWLAAVPVAIAAACLHGVVIGTRRGDKGRCAGCGYSRAGLAAGAACPECGRAP